MSSNFLSSSTHCVYSLGSPSWDTGEGDIYQLDTVRSSSPLVDDEDDDEDWETCQPIFLVKCGHWDTGEDIYQLDTVRYSSPPQLRIATNVNLDVKKKLYNSVNCKRVFYVLLLDTLHPDKQMALTWLGHEPRTEGRKGAAVAENARIALL